MPCNFLQFGDATFSNSRLQLSVILFYNKQSLPAAAETKQLSAVQHPVSFAEIKLPAVSPDASPVFRPDLAIRKGNLVLEISNSASSELFSRVGGILHAE